VNYSTKLLRVAVGFNSSLNSIRLRRIAEQLPVLDLFAM
jgi:hypothetical protein